MNLKSFFLAAVFLSILLIIFFSTNATNERSLNELSGYPFDVHYSHGAEQRAKDMAERCNNAIQFYEKELGVKPVIQLLVLKPADWQKHAGNVVYGMPLHSNGKLIVASQDNEFWRSFLPPVEKLPKNIAAKVIKTYSAEDGDLTMQPFFDLLAIHELGHAYHFSSGLNMQREWLAELFANLFLHVYVAENEPDFLSVATVFPEMVLATTKETNLTFTSLADFENRYDEIAQKHPENYGWYQCKLIAKAEDIYNSGGVKSIRKIWNVLEAQKETINDEELAKLLTEGVNQQVANVMANWEE